MKANANPYIVHGGNYFKNTVLGEIILSNYQKQKFPSKNDITLTRNVLLPGSLSSVRLLSLFRVTSLFFLEVAQGTVSNPTTSNYFVKF